VVADFYGDEKKCSKISLFGETGTHLACSIKIDRAMQISVILSLVIFKDQY
jgi:hypothetical protein